MRILENGKKKYKKNSFQLAKLISNDLFSYLNLSKNNKKFKMNYQYFKYKTAYRNKNDLKNLRRFFDKEKIKLVDTSQFIKYIGKNIIKFKKLKNYA